MKDYKHFVDKSNIGPKVEADTSNDSPEKTLEKIVDLIKPYISKKDLEK